MSIFGLYWIISSSTFLAADYFKIPQIIFSLYTMYFMINPQYLCSYGIPTVDHIQHPPLLRCLSWVQPYPIYSLSVLHHSSWSLAHTNTLLLLRCLLTPSPDEMSTWIHTIHHRVYLFMLFSMNSLFLNLYHTLHTYPFIFSTNFFCCAT